MDIILNSAKTHFSSLSSKNQEYWAFRKKAKREYSHALFQYPAMMVPQVQREFINTIQKIQPDLKWIYDPFVGSGTILTETMLSGLSFYGNDINPLAILLCKVKKGPFLVKKFVQDFAIILKLIIQDSYERVDINFTGLDKWFFNDVAISLSKIRRAIKELTLIHSRRFFWICLAETVKMTCNSRTTTYKLHIRPADELSNRKLDVFQIFKEIVERNLKNFRSQYIELKKRDLLKNGCYIKDIIIDLNDTSLDKARNHDSFDFLITSPPYGDNKTTIPYGQYSYLPLQWIDLEDIDRKADGKWLESTYGIDSLSLGGHKKNILQEKEKLEKKSVSLQKILFALKDQPIDRITRTLAFCKDLDNCLDPILNSLKTGSYMVWTLGNRCVGGKTIPLDKILYDFLLYRKGIKYIETIYRKIPSKRMAIKNNYAKTILKETILIMQKGPSNG